MRANFNFFYIFKPTNIDVSEVAVDIAVVVTLVLLVQTAVM